MEQTQLCKQQNTEMRNADKILIEKPQVERPVGKVWVGLKWFRIPVGYLMSFKSCLSVSTHVTLWKELRRLSPI